MEGADVGGPVPIVLVAQGRHHAIPRLPARVGRDAKADVVLDELVLAPVQFEIVARTGGLALVAVGSGNPTLVNGRRVALAQAHPIGPGDRIEVAGLEIDVAREAAPAAPPVPAEEPDMPNDGVSDAPDPVPAPTASSRLGVLAAWATAALLLLGLAAQWLLYDPAPPDVRSATRSTVVIAPRVERAATPVVEPVDPDAALDPEGTLAEQVAVVAPSSREPPPQPPVVPAVEPRPDPPAVQVPPPIADPPSVPPPAPPKLGTPGDDGPDHAAEGSTGEVVPPPVPDPPPKPPEIEKEKDGSIVTFMGRKLAGTGIVWVIDQSASISNMQLAVRRELAISLKQLTPKHTFNIVTFHETAVFFEDELVEGSPSNVERAWRWLKDQHSRGMTRVLTAFRAAVSFPGATTVILITDGKIHIEEFQPIADYLRARADDPAAAAKTPVIEIIPMADEFNKPEARLRALLDLVARQPEKRVAPGNPTGKPVEIK